MPSSEREREIVGRLADAFEAGDVDSVVALLTDDAWLTMPPEPYEYQGPTAIATFLEDRAGHRGTPLRLTPTSANGQPAFGCYLPSPQTDTAEAYGLLVLTLDGEQISAMTWFADSELFRLFGLPSNPVMNSPDRLGPPDKTTAVPSKACAHSTAMRGSGRL